MLYADSLNEVIVMENYLGSSSLKFTNTPDYGFTNGDSTRPSLSLVDIPESLKDEL